jgi:hypothetical protein
MTFNGTQIPAVGAALMAALSLCGCASIMTGSEQSVVLRSEPTGATVEIFDVNGLSVYDSATPASIVLKKGTGYFQGASYRVVVSKTGYKQQEIWIRSSLNAGWYLVGNFVLGGLIGWLVVDPLTGAMWTLSPDVLGIQLSATVSSAPEPASIRVVLLEDIPAGLRQQLTPVLLPPG